MPRDEIHKLSCEDAIAFVCDSTLGFAELSKDGRFIWLNRAYCEMLNAPIDIVMGTHFADMTHPADRGIDLELAKQVSEGAIPGYTLAKRYQQRGTTPQNPRVIWGMLSVSGKWLETQEFAGYRVQFQPYAQRSEGPAKDLIKISEAVNWCVTNWKIMVTIAAVAMSLTAGGSAQLLDTFRRAKDTADSVEQVLPSSPSGASRPQP